MRSNEPSFVTGLGCLIGGIIPLALLVYIFVSAIEIVVKRFQLQVTLTWFLCACVVSLAFIIYAIAMQLEWKDYAKDLRNKCKDTEGKLLSQYEAKEKVLRDSYEAKEKDLKENSERINAERSRMKLLIHAQSPFNYSASLKADMTTWIFDEAASYLHFKRPPAKTSAESIKKEYKKKYREAEYRFSEMLYKYEFLLKTFPELKAYVDDEESLQDLANTRSYAEVRDNYDNSRDYLSDEEWRRLTTAERNQLALDRWCKSNKSNHTIGLMYEMFISSELRKVGWDVIEFGIKNGLSDLGRDIICHRGSKTGIIQCKNWSSKKEIHENVICQLYGTTIAYAIEHPTETVQGVLLTTTKLSSMANKFAKQLNIEVHVKPIGLFPMIKCNINNGKKIYHLPFDQQYWRTEIKNDGEIYAWTVNEAEKYGFRRAFKHFA